MNLFSYDVFLFFSCSSLSLFSFSPTRTSSASDVFQAQSPGAESRGLQNQQLQPDGAIGKSVEWSMHWNHPRPSWPLPDDVALVPQFALTRGNFVLPLCSTDVAKLIAA